jgi:Tol biopolymer transport system component
MKSWMCLTTLLMWSVQAAAADAPAHALTPADLNQLARVSDPQVSPDGRYVVYVQRETDLEANRGRTDLWLLDLTHSKLKPRRLTQHSSNDTHPRWQVDGSSVYFLSSRTGRQQIWRLPLAGGEAVQITDYPLDVATFRFSPGGERIALRGKGLSSR